MVFTTAAMLCMFLALQVIDHEWPALEARGK